MAGKDFGFPAGLRLSPPGGLMGYTRTNQGTGPGAGREERGRPLGLTTAKNAVLGTQFKAVLKKKSKLMRNNPRWAKQHCCAVTRGKISNVDFVT